MIRVAIIGLGVIGGSLGMALSATGEYDVIGIDQKAETLELALQNGAAREVTGDLGNGVKSADIVVLAVPIADIILLAGQIHGFIPSGAVVTDVGSTKKVVVQELERLFPGRFVGGHPMTGSELSGFKGADRYLFENSLYVLTPSVTTGTGALEQIRRMALSTGAHLLQLSPEEHDLLVAQVSHLPHLVAISLMNQTSEVARGHPETLLLAAGGFRDLTRIASSDPRMWRDIYITNRENIIAASRRLRRHLEDLERELAEGNGRRLVAEMQEARRARMKIPVKARGFLPGVAEIVANVPDRPGALARLAGALGEQGINIIDLEIMRIREGEGGTIRLALPSDEQADSALAVLRASGFIVRKR